MRLLQDALHKCHTCKLPVHLTTDWILWPWPDGKYYCTSCNDERHEQDCFTEMERKQYKLTVT